MKICEKCNTAFLERHLLLPFWKQYQKIKVVVDDRERKYEMLTGKVNRLDAELMNIKRLVGWYDKNGSKESDIEQRYSKLEGEQRELTSEFETLQEDMGELTKRQGRLESEYIQTELKIKNQRLHLDEL